jgi:hypothetical protein
MCNLRRALLVHNTDMSASNACTQGMAGLKSTSQVLLYVMIAESRILEIDPSEGEKEECWLMGGGGAKLQEEKPQSCM